MRESGRNVLVKTKLFIQVLRSIPGLKYILETAGSKQGLVGGGKAAKMENRQKAKSSRNSHTPKGRAGTPGSRVEAIGGRDRQSHRKIILK